MADIHRGTGRSGEALEHYQSALKLAREIGDPYEEGKILEGIAELTLYTQRRDAARIVFRQALDIFERLGVPEAESARMRMATSTGCHRAGQLRRAPPARLPDPAAALTCGAGPHQGDGKTRGQAGADETACW